MEVLQRRPAVSFSSPPLKRPVKRCMSLPSCSLLSQNSQDVGPTKELKGGEGEMWDQPECLQVRDCESNQSANGWRNLRPTKLPMGQGTWMELCQREKQVRHDLTHMHNSKQDGKRQGLEVCRKWGGLNENTLSFRGFASCSAMHTQQALSKLSGDLLTVNP